tara:strand:- start:646 stop:1002 length:357 start_codon:yes stop_codon:yes gene_type:complete
MSRKYWKLNSDNEVKISTVPENDDTVDRSLWTEITRNESVEIENSTIEKLEKERLDEVEKLKKSTDKDDVRSLRNYPPIEDQLDNLWHCINNNETLKSQFSSWYNSIKSVKDKFPFND